MPIGTLYFLDTPFLVDTKKGAGPFLAMLPTPAMQDELVRKWNAKMGLGAGTLLPGDSFLPEDERALSPGWGGKPDGEPE